MPRLSSECSVEPFLLSAHICIIDASRPSLHPCSLRSSKVNLMQLRQGNTNYQRMFHSIHSGYACHYSISLINQLLHPRAMLCPSTGILSFSSRCLLFPYNLRCSNISTPTALLIKSNRSRSLCQTSMSFCVTCYPGACTTLTLSTNGKRVGKLWLQL